jgi:hypothetical protein
MSVLLFSASVIVFLVGLVSEQITSLMYRPEPSYREMDDTPAHSPARTER